ncbi:MAG: zf-HC2 domain-containing protein [Candidatus Solibacter sp.]
MTLFSRHVTDQLSAHIHGQLSPRETQRFERHLSECEQCRAHLDQVTFGADILEEVQIARAPEAIWNAIEAGLNQAPASRRWPLAAAALAATMLAAIVCWVELRAPAAQWNVVRIHGTQQMTGRVGPGDWIETDASTRAVVSVGVIGKVEVAGNTRVGVVAARPGEHRLALRRGRIHATITAPPRLFFVDTAAGTAIDLGCEYSLETDEEGSGLLQVTSGWVEFQWGDLHSLVPAGASCRTTRDGPGIPYFDDAPDVLKQVFAEGASRQLDTVLAAARIRDSLTLWHLLMRVGPAERERVFSRMAALSPVPAGVTRELVLKLDAPTLARWKDELAWTW